MINDIFLSVSTLKEGPLGIRILKKYPCKVGGKPTFSEILETQNKST